MSASLQPGTHLFKAGFFAATPSLPLAFIHKKSNLLGEEMSFGRSGRKVLLPLQGVFWVKERYG